MANRCFFKQKEWVRLVISSIWLSIFITSGCTSGIQESYDVISIAELQGLYRPYENKKLLSINLDIVFNSFLYGLTSRGAQILVAERNLGLISWYDNGVSFIAIPGQVKKSVSVGLTRGLAVSQRIVYGTARLKNTENGTWLYLHSLAFEVGTANPVFSDGSYEHSFFLELEKHLKIETPNFYVNETDLFPKPYRGSKDKVATTHEELYFKSFRTLPDINPAQIKEKGLARLYPVPMKRLWEACIDVASQYDVVAKISLEDGIIVFADGLTLPKDYSSNQKSFFKVLIAVFIESYGKDGAMMYVTYLSQNGLLTEPVLDLKNENKKELIGEFNHEPGGIAAAIIADQMFGGIATQLFYEERWSKSLDKKFTEK